MSRQRTRHRAKAGAGRLLAAAISSAMGGSMNRFFGRLGEPYRNGNHSLPAHVQLDLQYWAMDRRVRKRERPQGMGDTKPWQPSKG